MSWGYELLEKKFDFSRMGPQDKYDLANACGAYIKMIAPPTWWENPLVSLLWMTVAAALIYAAGRQAEMEP